MLIETLPPPVPFPSPPPRKPRLRNSSGRRLKILMVTPELGGSLALGRMGKAAPTIKAGGLADISSLLLDSFLDQGVDVQVALPYFKLMFQTGPGGHAKKIHLCHDREFHQRRSVYQGCPDSNLRVALAFQRDVLHYVIPFMRPDIIHCHDWMTGLIPAAARSMGIPSLFTMHNLHDERVTLAQIEDSGIDPNPFWRQLYFYDYPSDYISSRNHNPASLLASGILAADRMNTVSRCFLEEISRGCHGIGEQVADAIRGKMINRHAYGITNSPPLSYSPECDPSLAARYDAEVHGEGKRINKRAFQRIMGLEENENATLFFWPSRLDAAQKGCHLLMPIMHELLRTYREEGLQIAFVADGPYQRGIHELVESCQGEGRRVAMRSFDETLSRLGYAASDFTLMPSAYEPCGLAQMIGLRYGSLPVVHKTGGLRDTISRIYPDDPYGGRGNGFPFEVHDGEGLRWAMAEAMKFRVLPVETREANVARVMREAAVSFSPEKMVASYTAIYRELLESKRA